MNSFVADSEDPFLCRAGVIPEHLATQERAPNHA